ncbi:GNAT family N-acetyltransferase [Rhizobium halophytocola]|uniref:RimJ/RimL family protein N-acetyltransferase n=1 Tax=Rhizobium halophytocola TaxID=735519 RepID=A0ABS4DTI6_9HYPH|nr:GNAT family protein [Rhizobium halophytocola]MBP1848991.1 RimJ/RimL family protein N-acetyltransferase [Rhizobium halophytocola]
MSDLSQYKVEAPKPVTIEGRRVTVKPYDRARHLSALWDALGGEEVNALLKYFPQAHFAGPAPFGDWLDRARDTLGWVTCVFQDKANGDILGMASYMRPDPANGVVEVGSVAHGAAMKRSPLSTEAHYLMARHVFEGLGYRRYEWKCHNGNEPSKATARRLGFTFEGVFRQHMISKGENRDTVWFSMIDGEWPQLKAVFEAWLSPDNFDAEGRQIRKLDDIRSSMAGSAA